MPIKSFKEFVQELEEKQAKYDACEHDFEDEPVWFSSVGRFGGHCVPVFRCKKCGYTSCKDEEHDEVIKHYDEGGRPLK